MKNLFFGWFIILLLGSCTSDNEEDLFGQESCSETVSLTNDVQPIIDNNCAVSGCHVSGAQFPDLRDEQNIVAHADGIQRRTQLHTMPPPSSGLTLTDEEIATLRCWVDNGAPNN